MKLSAKSLSTFFICVLAGTFLGSLAWEVLERIIRLVPALDDFSLTMDHPIQIFDLYVAALSFRANPGSLLGLISGGVVFFKI